MKLRGGRYSNTVAAIFIASSALVRVGAAQEETQTPREAVEQKQTDYNFELLRYTRCRTTAAISGAFLSHRGLGRAQVEAGAIAACNSILM